MWLWWWAVAAAAAYGAALYANWSYWGEQRHRRRPWLQRLVFPHDPSTWHHGGGGGDEGGGDTGVAVLYPPELGDSVRALAQCASELSCEFTLPPRARWQLSIPVWRDILMALGATITSVGGGVVGYDEGLDAVLRLNPQLRMTAIIAQRDGGEVHFMYCENIEWNRNALSLEEFLRCRQIALSSFE